MVEERKLIRLGNSSFALALPKGWIEKSGLKKGDKVFLENNSNGEIIISSDFKKINGDNKIEINVHEKEEKQIAREIISAYTSGYKVITVNGNKKELKIAKEIARQFLNLELIEETEKTIKLKDLLDISDINLENFMRRMDNNLKEMFSIMKERGHKENKTKIEELYDIDKDITKYYFLIWRVMNIGLDNPGMQSTMKMISKDFVAFFWISYNMEKIGDELKRIVRHIPKENKENEHFHSLLRLIEDNYNGSIKAFFEKNKGLAEKIILSKLTIANSCTKLSEIRGFEIISEKMHQINSSIHDTSKMIFYNF